MDRLIFTIVLLVASLVAPEFQETSSTKKYVPHNTHTPMSHQYYQPKHAESVIDSIS